MAEPRKNWNAKTKEKKKKRYAKKRAKMSAVKPEQENLCRFITVKETVAERINGKFKNTGKVVVKNGLQVKNRIFLCDGSYKFLNRSTLWIHHVYADIPEWATEQLIERYHSFAAEAAKEPKEE